MMHGFPAKAREWPGQVATLTRNAEHGEGWPISGDRMTAPLKGPLGGILTMVDWTAVEREDIS